MRRFIVVALFVALVGGGAFALSQGGFIPNAGQPTAGAALPTIPPVKASGEVVAEARVVPVRFANLSLQTGGLVSRTLVAEGDEVTVGQALITLDSTELSLVLAQAQANLAASEANQARLKAGPSAEDLAAAKQGVSAAQAAYEDLLNPSADRLTVLRADADRAKVLVDQAQAAYDRIGGDTNPAGGVSPQRQNLQLATLDYQRALAAYNVQAHPTKSQIQQAQAVIDNAKSQLARLQPITEDLAAAAASADAARAARDLAAERLSKTRLLAPFAGRVVTLDARAGENVAPGVTVVRIADLSAFQVESTDLTELAVARIKEGDAATVTVDALPGLAMTGTVSRVRAFGENRQGDIVYTVTVKLDKQDPRLRWNMTAAISVKGR